MILLFAHGATSWQHTLSRLDCYECCSGFVASGPVVVLAEAALRMGPKPSYLQQMLLFQLVAGFTLAGSRTASAAFISVLVLLVLLPSQLKCL